jgi:DNA-binding response OmpR family regulator
MAHVLLIEPDRLLGTTYNELLKVNGHSVVVCATAQVSISAADYIVPDIVIMELQLVRHSGIEFLYEFRSYIDWLNVPVIIHTYVPPSEFSSSRDILMRELDVSMYLYKPQTSLRQLARAVDATLIA